MTEKEKFMKKLEGLNPDQLEAIIRIQHFKIEEIRREIKDLEKLRDALSK